MSETRKLAAILARVFTAISSAAASKGSQVRKPLCIGSPSAAATDY